MAVDVRYRDKDGEISTQARQHTSWQTAGQLRQRICTGLC
jgi:hypothetical protein